jgi:hypothetical protein
MKKKSNTQEIDYDPTGLDKLAYDLEIWREEWKKSPEYRLALKRKKHMVDFKKNNPLTSILNGPCDKCIIKATCKKSFFDGSACNKYRYALKKFLKDKGWYQNGGREKTN